LTNPSAYRFVNLLLLISERAWAHAMSMRDAHASDKSGITGSSRSHIISRLHKATQTSSHLFSILSSSSSTASQIDILEARAYNASLFGAMYFEKQAWEVCVKSYSEARIIYSALNMKEGKEVYKELLAETVDPSIRYAAYQLRMARSVAIPTIARKYFPREDKGLVQQVEALDADVLNERPTKARAEIADTGSEAAPKTISWRERTVNLEDASIAAALAAVKNAEKKLAETLKGLGSGQAKERAAAYDDILIASQDAVDATKHAIDELVGEGVGQGDKRMQSLQITRTAVGYEMVSWRIGRNRVLVGERDGIDASTKSGKKGRKGKMQKEEGTGYSEFGLD
jgi:signal recognition particle subunit SRP68